MASKNQSYSLSDTYGTEPGTLNEGEIAGVLVGTVFLVFMLLPILLSYGIVYCRQFHIAWKNKRRRREQERRLEDALARGDLLGCDGHGAVEMSTISTEEPLPDAELTCSEPPPSYVSVVVNGDSSGELVSPPAYAFALNMEKV